METAAGPEPCAVLACRGSGDCALAAIERANALLRLLRLAAASLQPTATMRSGLRRIGCWRSSRRLPARPIQGWETSCALPRISTSTAWGASSWLRRSRRNWASSPAADCSKKCKRWESCAGWWPAAAPRRDRTGIRDQRSGIRDQGSESGDQGRGTRD